MNPEVRDKWTTALRSGEYEQQRKGVLNPGYLFGEESYAYIRDDVIFNWSGLENSTQISLAQMNDSGKTFNEIADYIEENL